jgi:hypothetical protein
MANKQSKKEEITISERLVREEIDRLNQNTEEIKKLKVEIESMNKPTLSSSTECKCHCHVDFRKLPEPCGPSCIQSCEHCDTTTQGDDSMKEQLEAIVFDIFYADDWNEAKEHRAKLFALFQSQQKQLNIGFLRQYLNENKITDSSKMVTNEEIETMLGVEPDKTLERVREKFITTCEVHGMEDLYNCEFCKLTMRNNNIVNEVLEFLEAEQKGSK